MGVRAAPPVKSLSIIILDRDVISLLSCVLGVNVSRLGSVVGRLIVLNYIDIQLIVVGGTW